MPIKVVRNIYPSLIAINMFYFYVGNGGWGVLGGGGWSERLERLDITQQYLPNA